jgi:SAM-dependent methyltransferase
MPDRTRARELAHEHREKNDPTGWFEQLYREAEQGTSELPWADLRANTNLLNFAAKHPFNGAGKSALVVGAGLGDDAEQVSAWGYATTAFDVSETAIRNARKRFPNSHVEYSVANLLTPLPAWRNAFDFVLEIYTVQSLPPEIRAQAIAAIASFVRPGGELLVICRGADAVDPTSGLPWPLTPDDLLHFIDAGLTQATFEDFFDPDEPETRRFRVLYRRD